MTTGDTPIDAQDADARLAQRQREQLSALMDGEMPAEQAHFLRRRLGHDAALAGCWERWHLAGDVLRREPVAVPGGGTGAFAAGVARAIEREASARPERQGDWRKGLGLAAAASIAAVALLVARPALDRPADGPASRIATGPATAPAADIAATRADPVRQVAVPQFADVPAAAPGPVAASAPDRVAASQQPVRRIAGPPSTPPVAEARAAPAEAVVVLASDAAPFASPAEPQARPWPRADVPGLAAAGGGTFAVGFEQASQAPSFYPFEPQLPARVVAPEPAAVDPERSQ